MAFKTILLASALAFGGTAIAQDTMTTPPADPAAQTQTTTPPPADPAAPPPADPAAAAPMAPTQPTPTDPAAPMTSTMPAAPGAPMTSPAPMQPAPMASGTTGTFSGTESAGGYQPANPPMSGMAQPGVTPVFTAAPPVAQAYPAPAPLQSYPICKKGQTDKCRQRGG